MANNKNEKTNTQSINTGKIKDIDIKQICKSYIRTLKLTKKPTQSEFMTIAKVAGAGMFVVGLVGFVIYVAMAEIPKTII